MERIDTLVLDEQIFPRASVNPFVVGQLAESLTAGEGLPPVVVDRATRKVVDGWHRIHAVESLGGEEIEVQFFDYPDDRTMFAHSVKLNRVHGFKLSPYDLKNAILKLESYGFSTEKVSQIVGYATIHVEDIIKGFASSQSGEPLPLKRAFSHMKGQVLSPEQEQVIRRAPGLSMAFYLERVNEALAADLVPINAKFRREAERFIELWSTVR